MKERWDKLTGAEKAKLVIKILLGLFAVIFAIRNWQTVEVIPVFFRLKMPLTLVIVFCLGVGFALSSLFDYKKFKSKNKEIEDLKTKITQLIGGKEEK